MFVDRNLPRSHRNGLRWKVTIPASVSGSITRRLPVTVTNISAKGCRADTPHRFYPGSFLLLSFSSLGPLGAIVTWRKEGAVGFRFVRPLDGAVLYHIIGGTAPLA